MHSAILRGTDFLIHSNGQIVRHADYFSGFTVDTRLGLITPNGSEGIGAAMLVLGYVTAFYDCHRENADQFHAYPEFYTFQSGSQLTDYGMLDIYPMEKNVRTERNPESILHAVIEKKINILLIPGNTSRHSKNNRDLIESIQKTVHTCFLYSSGGEVADPDVSIQCHRPEINDWIRAVTDSMPDKKTNHQGALPSPPFLKQSYFKVPAESALNNL